MAKMHSAGVIPMLREDGTVYLHDQSKLIGERLCKWTVVFLWTLVVVVIVATVLWS